jgi:hypothetical protein
MATATKVESRERGGRALRTQPHRFVGLFLAPLAGLLTSWLIHVWTLGVNLHWGPLSWVVHASAAAPYVANTLIVAATFTLSAIAWWFTQHREKPKQIALSVSVLILGLLFAVNAGAGPNYWWSPGFILGAWLVATTWSLARLDVARNDKRDGEQAEQKDGFWDKLGVSKRTLFRSKITHDDDGQPSRVDIDIQHDREVGETVSVIQDGLSAMESAAGGPPGLSTAVQDPERADRSRVSMLLKDPFKRNARVGPLTAPGGSIADWATVADYADGKPGFVTTAAGKHMPTSTSYGLIGATRAGKTGTETQLLTEWGSRMDWACLYLNQAKGLQDIRPLLPIIEAAVIAEDGERGLGDYVVAGQQVMAIMTYRQQELARFAVSAWSPRCCDPNPDKRPTRLGADGRRIVMDRMPFLTAHFGEADTILNSGRMGDNATFITSKGLSLGVNTGWSLQRPDWKAMPTGLRANIGLWFVHGLNGGDEEDFVLDEQVRKAGANPGRWGQRRPGQHYMIGPGIDEDRFPVALKTRFLVGDEFDRNGLKIDFDELNDRYMAEMLRRNQASAPNMCKLDRGSAEATDGWWDVQVIKTNDLRFRMLHPGRAEEPATAPQTSPRKSRAFAGEQVPQSPPQTDDDSAGEIDPEEMEELMEEFDEDAATVTEVEGVPVYGDDPVEAAAARAVDLSGPAVIPETDYDPLADSADGDKPPARTREEALAALRSTLVRMIDNPKYAYKKMPGTALVGPTAVFEELGINSRPWVSEELARIMISGGEVEDGVHMERFGPPAKGQYLLSRMDGADHAE